MKFNIRKQILELLPTVWEGVKYAKKQNTDIQSAKQVLGDCSYAIEMIDQILKENLSDARYVHYFALINLLKSALVILAANKENSKSTTKFGDEIRQHLHEIKNSLKQEEEVKIEVLFLPYKSSMWDSLESIWRAAEEDPLCDCYVMPIPYYERDADGNLSRFCYEGEQFPEYVPITKYQEYDIAVHMPDIIYIHNPYDQNNKVTTVHPKYYSSELKKYTEMLVYAPYYIAGGYSTEERAAAKLTVQGAVNSDKIIVQNKVMGDFVNRLLPGKAVVSGSPKTDFAEIKTLSEISIPNEWKEKIGNNKVILLNWSLASILGYNEWINRYSDILDILLQSEKVTILWRPHPLMEATLESMRPHFLEKYHNLKNRMLMKSNVILDETPDLERAIMIADAMVTDLSSLIYKFWVTKKPIMILTSSLNRQRVNPNVNFFNCSSSYFWYVEDYIYEREEFWKVETEIEDFRKTCHSITGTQRRDIYLKEFVDIVLTGNDYLKEERIDALKKNLSHIGNCGRTAHQIISEAVLGK